MTIQEWEKQREERIAKFEAYAIQKQEDVLEFIKDELGLKFQEIKEGIYRGAFFCKWTISFNKSGKMVMRARNVRKSFSIESGLDIYNIFTGFEII